MNFFSLPALKSLVSARKTDLGRLRSLGVEAETKITALQGQNGRYSQSFIQQESAKIRQSAMERATALLRSNETFPKFQLTAEQKSAWTTPAYLARAAGEETTEKKLLKLISLQFGLPRMTVETCEQLFDEHAAAGNWAEVSAIFSDMVFRGKAGDTDAASAHLRMGQFTPPDCQEALDLISQSEQLREYVNYALTSISTGVEDMGKRMEAYAAMQKDRDESATRAQADAYDARHQDIRQKSYFVRLLKQLSHHQKSLLPPSTPLSLSSPRFGIDSSKWRASTGRGGKTPKLEKPQWNGCRMAAKSAAPPGR